jgi:hypothetical protein
MPVAIIANIARGASSAETATTEAVSDQWRGPTGD